MFNKNDFIEFIYSIVIYDLKKKEREMNKKWFLQSSGLLSIQFRILIQKILNKMLHLNPSFQSIRQVRN